MNLGGVSQWVLEGRESGQPLPFLHWAFLSGQDLTLSYLYTDIKCKKPTVDV